MAQSDDQIRLFGDNLELLESTKNFIQYFNSKNEIEVKTSGSTGIPKVYNVKKERFIYSAERTCRFFNLKEGDKSFLCISPEYIGGKMMIIRSLVQKMELHHGKIESFPFHQKEEYDFAAFVPLQIKRIVEVDIDYLRKIKNIIIGGGVLNATIENVLAENGINAYATFGMTETLSHIALRKVGTENYQLLNGLSISQGQDGRLIIHDPKVTETESLQTNDIVEIINDKEFKWLGRFDNIINTGGVKVIPENIESKLIKKINQSFFIDKVPDERLGDKVVLVVEGSLIQTEDLFDGLSKFEIPKEIIELPKFIHTDTKKINRKKTMELVLGER